MNEPLLSKRKVDAISNGLFLVALGVLLYTNKWWPGILVAIWILVATREFLTGRIYDLIISSIILGGLFVISFFEIKWSVLMPVLFVLGGIYIIFREYFYAEDETVEEKKLHETQDDIDERK
jgi:hypothetical protein